MPEDVFTESLKSPECIYEQFNDLTESINFLSDKFWGYEEDRAKKDKIIEDIKSVVDSLSTKVEKLKETLRPARTTLKKKLSPSTWDCRRERRNNRWGDI